MFNKKLHLLLITLWMTIVSVKCSNYHLCRILPFSQWSLQVAREVEKLNEGYVFLNKIGEGGFSVYILVPDRVIDQFSRDVSGCLVNCKLLDENVDPEFLRLNVANPNRTDDEYSWNEYHELNDTYKWMRSLEQKYSKYVKILDLGKSYKKEDILGVKISFGTNTDSKVIFIEGGAHGEQWISPAVVTYLINKLLTSTTDREFIEKFEWHLVPHTNPDGFAYTHKSNRFWHKTVSEQPFCFGVDLNRNWGFLYNEPEVTRYPCNKLYPGLRNFTEIEAEIFFKYFGQISSRLFFYMAINAPDRHIYIPNDNGNIWNGDDLKRVVDAGVNAILNKYQVNYSGETKKRTQPKSGTSMDWIYNHLAVNYTFTFHLPPAYQYEEMEFLDARSLMPSSKIIEMGEQVFCGLKKMIEEAEAISSTAPDQTDIAKYYDKDFVKNYQKKSKR